ncbi:MAG TPA: hypothetical protein VNR39_02105 [Pseudolabrys sp.]|nr:hypothetical protein [Pseudolabrys sp.]
MTHDRNHDYLDDVLARVTAPRPVDDAAVARVLKRLQPPLPRQKAPWWRLPAVLLNWEFAPAWPRMAALACSAVLGFYVGIAGLDRPFDQLDQAAITSADAGFFVFDPEPLTGARP